MKLLVMIIMLVSFNSFGAERNIYDIMFMPKVGVSYGDTILGIRDLNAKVESSGYKYKITQYANVVQQNIGHVIRENALIEASLNYVSAKQKTKDEDGTVYKFNNNGLSDITIKNKWRLMEGDTLFDISGSILLSTGPSQIDDNSGDNKNGGHIFELQGVWGSKNSYYQYAIGATLIRNFEAEEENDMDIVITGAYSELSLQPWLQFLLFEGNFLGGSVEYTISEASENHSSSKSLDLNIYFSHILSSALAGKFMITNSVLMDKNDDRYYSNAYVAVLTYLF